MSEKCGGEKNFLRRYSSSCGDGKPGLREEEEGRGYALDTLVREILL